MTTENGMPKSSTMRKHIEHLRDRLVYLDTWIVDYESYHDHEYHGPRRAEREAIEWALPVLEAEWRDLARLRAQHIEPAEHRNHALERAEQARAQAAAR